MKPSTEGALGTKAGKNKTKSSVEGSGAKCL